MNARMQQARDAALSVLSPSRADLEHGLDLHRQAVVSDAYGFAPVAPIVPEALRAAAEAGASAREMRDLREEMTMLGNLFDPVAREEYQEAWRESGVTCVFQNAGEESFAVDALIKRLARFTHVTDGLRGFLRRAVTAEDVAAAKRDGQRALLFSGNGVPPAQGWNSVEEELSYIRVFFQLGIRMMHLTYNRRNMIGDGCNEPADAGLSDFGRAVVAEMNRVGVIVDVAHSGWRTSLEAAKASRAPMVASHSVCCAVNRHPRGKPDEVIRAIADTGGYIGICGIPGFLGGQGNIASFLDHVVYAVRTFGADHVAIGTDTAWVSERYHEPDAKAPTSKSRPRWENFWPADDPLFSPEFQKPEPTLSLSWINWPLFTVGMVQRGIPDEDIRKVLGGNVVRVLAAVLDARQRGW